MPVVGQDFASDCDAMPTYSSTPAAKQNEARSETYMLGLL